MATSQNGWSANDRSVIASYTVPGTSRKLALRKGDVSVVLLDLAAWIDANIVAIDTGELDDWGYAERPIRGSSTTLSNHASGTAIDLDALRHPLGNRGTWGAVAARIRAHVATYDGVIRWGEDYSQRPDGMHFEINAGAAATKRVADRVRGRASTAAAPTPPSVGRRLLHLATPFMEGDDVREIQTILARWYGKPVSWVDGVYGPGTVELVKRAQAGTPPRPALTPDGEVGPLTRRKLGVPV